MKKNEKFTAVNLSANITRGGGIEECPSGGSTWCTGDSSGCKGGTNCFGASTKLEFIDRGDIINADILVTDAQLKQLKSELETILKRISIKNG
jgi:hypothetical protein